MNKNKSIPEATLSEQPSQPPPLPPTTKQKRLARSSSTSKFEQSVQNQSKNNNQKLKNISNSSSNDNASTATSSTTIQNETNNNRRTRSQSRTSTFENISSQLKSTRPTRNVAGKKVETQIENKNEENFLTKNFAAININENNNKQTLKSSNEIRKKQTTAPAIKIDSDKDDLSKNNTSTDKKSNNKLVEINEKDELLNVCPDNKTKYTKSTSTPSGMRRKPLKPPQDISFIDKPE